MQRYDFFFKQKVTESELDSAFGSAETAINNVILDNGIIGITSGGAVSQNAGTANLTVDVSGPATIYDQTAQRISWSATQDVDCSIDENSNPTAVVTPGNHRILSIFAKFKRVLSDPRLDGSGDTVYFNSAESFELHVAAGAEASSPTPPVLRANEILLADIELDYGQTQILNADISTTRRQWAIKTTSGISVAVGQIEEAVQALADGVVSGLAAHKVSTADEHVASAVNYTSGPAWNDGTTNPAATVEAQLDKIVTDLADEASIGNGGADKVGSKTFTVGSLVVASGSVREQLVAVLGAANDHITNASGAHAASAVNYAGGGAWVNGTTNPATTVEGQLDKVITDLSNSASAGNSGADKVGITAIVYGSENLPAGGTRDAIYELLMIVGDHKTDTTNAHAASAIGGSSFSYGQATVAADDVQDQHTALLTLVESARKSVNVSNLCTFFELGEVSANYTPKAIAQGPDYLTVCVANHDTAAAPPRAFLGTPVVGSNTFVAKSFTSGGGLANADLIYDVLDVYVGSSYVFMAVGGKGDNSKGILEYSLDGDSWSDDLPANFNVTNGEIFAIATAPSASTNKTVVVGGGGDPTYVGRISYHNGSGWSNGSASGGSFPATNFLDVATKPDGSIAVAVAGDNFLYTSTDGFATWSVNSTAIDDIQSVVWDPILAAFVFAASNGGSPKLFVSTNGTSIAASYNLPSSFGSNVATNQKGFIVCAKASTRIIDIFYGTVAGSIASLHFGYELPEAAETHPRTICWCTDRLMACLGTTKIYGTARLVY